MLNRSLASLGAHVTSVSDYCNATTDAVDYHYQDNDNCNDDCYGNCFGNIHSHFDFETVFLICVKSGFVRDQFSSKRGIDFEFA